jgi:hypothetical protein
MNYHLNRNGQNLGIFPLEELRQRRSTGELLGFEMVWCPGMKTWQTLDSVLVPGTPPVISSAAPTRKSSNVALILCVAAGVFLLCVVCLFLAFRTTAKVIKKESIKLLSEFPSDPKESLSMAAASKPVKPGPNSKNYKDSLKMRRDFRLRQWLEGYKLRSSHTNSYDAEAIAMINNWIAENCGGKVDTNLPSASKIADKLARNPECNDPLILTIAAVESPEMFEANDRLERALRNFDNSRHKAYPKLFANVTLASKLTKNQKNRVPVLDGAAVQFFKESFKDGSFVPEDQEEIAEILIHGWGEGFYERNAGAICTVVDSQGKPFKWLALVLRGDTATSDAWAARGSGYSSSVSSQGWQGFKKHLARAEKDLTEAWQLHPELPMAPALMISVSLGNADIETMRLWFDRAVEAQIDYPTAWAKLRWGLRPRWYGDLESMLALGVTAVKTKRFDTDVPRVFFDVVSDLEKEADLKGGKHLYGRKDIWPLLQEMYEGYIAEPSQAESRNNWRNSYAIVSYLAGDYEVAAKQLQALQWKLNPEKTVGWCMELSCMPLEVAARTGKQGTEVAEAEDYRKRRKINDALRIYSQLIEATDLDNRTRAFVQDRLATLDLEKRFQAGEWVSLMPSDTNLVGWCLSRGTCQSVSQGAVEMASGSEGHMIYSRARLGRDFEAKGSFEVVKSTSDSFQGGLMMGLPEFDAYGWNAFRIKRNSNEGEIASFSQHWTSQQVSSPVTLSKSNTFTLRCRDGKVSASVNNKEIFKEVTEPENYVITTNEFFLGLGAFNDMNTTVIKYHDVQVRK